MSLISMTGFSRSDGVYANVCWHWEIRCVNGKSMDVRCRLPHGYEQIEPDIRKLFAKYMSRGNAQVSLSLKEEEAAGELIINETALARAVQAAKRLVEEAGATAPSADGLLALKGIVELSVQEEDEDIIKARNAEVLDSLETALGDLVSMRKREGEQLSNVISTQLTAIGNLMGQVRHEITNANELARARVARQVARLVEASQSLDEDRLYQEAVLLAAKADITEELDRLDAHILAARDYLTAEGPIGRKLEFLIQEFNREANTLCSKSPTKEITALGLDMKAAIDQIREQVMNIE
jgi:uncharacterized protein (TIGR00255 family)